MAFLIFIIPYFVFSGLGKDQGYFVGADDSAGTLIEETGYQPWIKPIWKPPSGGMESLLFAFQAAIGAFIIGYIFGYYRNKKKDKHEP